ncbi:hypothetical protein, partial [Mycobacterium noviomagense]|uniref:hypothetical protein n=1 Tax=Mycobacterium noviomagense TaxID=459858 RepID=UPI001B804C4D
AVRAAARPACPVHPDDWVKRLNLSARTLAVSYMFQRFACGARHDFVAMMIPAIEQASTWCGPS